VNEQAADIIEQAIAVIERDGWWRGTRWPGSIHDLPHEPGMPVCAMGAIEVATGCDNWDLFANTAGLLSRFLRVHAGKNLLVSEFNDHPETTVDDVLDLMRHCVKELRQ
jgi:hypothetical protein